jgi:ribosome biogenesis GTPase
VWDISVAFLFSEKPTSLSIGEQNQTMTDHNDKSFQKDVTIERHQKMIKKMKRRQELQTVTKKLKRNRQPKPARRKNWLGHDPNAWDELDYEVEERIMPRGEAERRRTLEQAALNTSETEHDEPDPAIATAPESQPGQVIEVSQGLCRVDLGSHTLLCTVRGALTARETGFTNVVAVGDEVIVHPDGTEGGVIETVLPRRSLLVRPDVFYDHLQQVIAANVDQLLIISSWREPTIWLELVDRYLITAQRNHLPTLICLNKIDLAQNGAECEAVLRPYQSLGYPIVLTSALTGEGIDELQTLLHHRTTVLAGLSGVGKSSLLAALQPGLQVRVGTVSETSGEGRHTTSQATLIRLGPDEAIIDTPGIREFGLTGLHRGELEQFFPEIARLSTGCRFKNCTHLNEPDCAVRQAEATGDLATSRYHSYQKILATLPG